MLYVSAGTNRGSEAKGQRDNKRWSFWKSRLPKFFSAACFFSFSFLFIFLLKETFTMGLYSRVAPNISAFCTPNIQGIPTWRSKVEKKKRVLSNGERDYFFECRVSFLKNFFGENEIVIRNGGREKKKVLYTRGKECFDVGYRMRLIAVQYLLFRENGHLIYWPLDWAKAML